MSARPRRWLELSARSPGAEDLEPLLAEALVALGGRAVEERGGWFVTHLDEPDDVDALLRRARSLFASVSRAGVELRTAWIDHEDWAESWKRGLATRRITPRLVVTPSWEPVEPERDDRVIVLDPGMAFGTAEHGTTRGCLRLLDHTVREGHRVLDVGAGSGILSIAAALLGAGEVLALEGDELAVEVLVENVEANGVADRVASRACWADEALLGSLGRWDGVVANIESGILRPLLRGFATALPAGAWLILSGILEGEWEAMCADTERAGFLCARVDADGEWRSGLFARR